MKKEDKPVIVKQDFDLSVEEVWQAITQAGKMKEWFFENIPDFRAEQGFSTQFDVRSDVRVFTHIWKVVKVLPCEKISINWKYDGYPGDSIVCFELEERRKGSVLKLSHRVLEDFPEDIPEFTRESCLKGWEFFIGKRLKDYLSKKDKG